jgi:predicted nucleotidyltransferase component of viral defense system
MNVKIDISRKIWDNNNYEIVNFFGTDINVQTKDTIFANKLVALTDRKSLANRDIYDIYFFFKNSFDINEDLIFERT